MGRTVTLAAPLGRTCREHARGARTQVLRSQVRLVLNSRWLRLRQPSLQACLVDRSQLVLLGWPLLSLRPRRWVLVPAARGLA